MQFIDLKSQQSKIKDKIDDRIQTVLNHGKYIMGPEVKELENKLASFVGAKHCITCASGTDALLMPLIAWNLKPGDAVLTTPFTFIASAEVIQLLGATPVFVDIDPKTFNIDPVDLEKKAEHLHKEGRFRLKACIPVDLFGLPADYTAIEAVAHKYDFRILEDGAQGLGGDINGQKACSFGDAASTSFFPAKPLGCYGDGGAVFTESDDLAEKLISIRVHGKGGHKYDNVRIGINGRLDTLQAAILLEKLEIFSDEIKQRNMAAGLYSKYLKQVVVPFVPDRYTSVWAQYSVLAESKEHRDQLQARLKENSIPSAVYYPRALHLQTAFSNLNYKEGDFPVSEDISQKIFSLPMHPYLKKDDIKQICQIIDQ